MTSRISWFSWLFKGCANFTRTALIQKVYFFAFLVFFVFFFCFFFVFVCLFVFFSEGCTIGKLRTFENLNRETGLKNLFSGAGSWVVP